MSFSIFRRSRKTNIGRRRPGRRPLGVESMEPRALLASAAVTAAIGSIQSAEAYVQKTFAAEVATLQSNIVTIEKATSTFIAQHGAGNKALTAAAIRDEKFAIGQQLFLIGVLDQGEAQFKATLGAGISGLKAGRLDPRSLPAILTAGENTLAGETGAVASTATFGLDGLTGTFAAGKA